MPRSYAAQLVGELRLVELTPLIIDLVDRPRGADLVVVTEALVSLAEVDPAAAAKLRTLCDREDEIGERARALGRGTGPPPREG